MCKVTFISQYSDEFRKTGNAVIVINSSRISASWEPRDAVQLTFLLNGVPSRCEGRGPDASLCELSRLNLHKGPFHRPDEVAYTLRWMTHAFRIYPQLIRIRARTNCTSNVFYNSWTYMLARISPQISRFFVLLSLMKQRSKNLSRI